MLRSINPYNNELISEYEEHTNEQVEAIVELCAKAFNSWKTTSFSERSDLLIRTSELLLDERSDLAGTITLEMGKPIREARQEIEKCAWVCRYYAENASKFLENETFRTDAAISRVQYEPLGTILGIMPWNFPFWQVFRFLAPTLMAGNTIILKHASNVQECALKIENLIIKAGFPESVFKVLKVSAIKIEQIIGNRYVKAVTLTGSEKAGINVAGLSGMHIKKTVLELGGSNGFIILDDCDLDQAVAIGIAARFMNAGQSCIAAKRFFVQQKIFKAFINKFKKAVADLIVGDPMKENTDIGPLSNIYQAEDVERQVKESIVMGAKPLFSVLRDKAFFFPNILVNVSTSMPVFNEEVFGPVAPVLPFKDDIDAVKLSNQSRFGLGVSILTSDTQRAEKLIPLFEEGAVFINSLVKSDPRLPFGGVKNSGYGRELSWHGIREFVNVKTVYIQTL